ncbi:MULTISPECIES: GreA/GreB family elongation factor [unclassified Bradyrhizobium]
MTFSVEIALRFPLTYTLDGGNRSSSRTAYAAVRVRFLSPTSLILRLCLTEGEHFAYAVARDSLSRHLNTDALDSIARIAAGRGDINALFLRGELTRATCIPDEENDPDFLRTRVRMGSSVTYWTEAGTSGLPHGTSQLVYPDQYKYSKWHLSVLSPLGAALNGLRIGSQMPFFDNGSMHHVRIESVDKPSSNVVPLFLNRPAGMGHNRLPPDDEPDGPTAA